MPRSSLLLALWRRAASGGKRAAERGPTHRSQLRDDSDRDQAIDQLWVHAARRRARSRARADRDRDRARGSTDALEEDKPFVAEQLLVPAHLAVAARSADDRPRPRRRTSSCSASCARCSRSRARSSRRSRRSCCSPRSSPRTATTHLAELDEVLALRRRSRDRRERRRGAARAADRAAAADRARAAAAVARRSLRRRCSSSASA